MSTYTHDDAIKHFQDLIWATTRLSFPLFSENEEKQSYLLKCKNNLDLDFDNILNNLHPIFNLSSTKRESIWKKSFKNAEKKFNYTTSYKLNSFFLQEVMHEYAQIQFEEIKNYYSAYHSKNTKQSSTTPTTPSTSKTNSGAISSGLGIGNYGNVNKSYEEEKFHALQGHGFAAERANNLYDKLSGHDAKVLGDNNAKNGADRIVDGIYIQSKYCASGSKCINECFDNNGHGSFRYMQDGKPMQIEVPSDKYDSAVQAMKEKILKGQVDGISDPQEAENIVRKGHFTYEQAKNIAKAGTIESLTYDAVNGAIISASSFGITALITFATSTWQGEDFNSALKTATKSGLTVGGATFLTSIIASQLSKAGLNSALVGSSEAIVAFMGPKASATLINAFRTSGNIYGAAAMKSAAKLLRGNFISAGISTLVLSSVDISRAFNRKISGKQLFKNITSTASTVAGSTAGWMAGAALGTAIFPGVGTAVGTIGGLIGSAGAGALANKSTNKILNSFIEDDTEKMLKIIETRLKDLSNNYLLNAEEIDNIISNLNNLLSSDSKILMNMFASSNKYAFASNILVPIIEDETKNREYIHTPTENNFTNSLKELLVELA